MDFVWCSSVYDNFGDIKNAGEDMINDNLKTQIGEYCYLVQRGKPSAMLPVQNRYVNEAMEIVEGYKDLYYINKYLSDGWREFWIYRKTFMSEVIKNLPEKPKTIYDHWIIGKAFGYSDEAIEEYINKEQL